MLDGHLLIHFLCTWFCTLELILLSSLLPIHNLLLKPTSLFSYMYLIFALQFLSSLSLIIHSWPCIIKTVLLIFNSPYFAMSCTQYSLSSYGLPAQEYLMNISASSIIFKYQPIFKFLSKCPPLFLSKHLLLILVGLVPMQYNTPLISHHFTNPCPSALSSWGCILHELSSPISSLGIT